DFSTAVGPVAVVLEGADETGFRGTASVGGTGPFAYSGINVMQGSGSSADSLRAGPSLTGGVFTGSVFTDGVHFLRYSGFEQGDGPPLGVSLDFGPVLDTGPLDLTLRYTPSTRIVRLVQTGDPTIEIDSVTLA